MNCSESQGFSEVYTLFFLLHHYECTALSKNHRENYWIIPCAIISTSTESDTDQLVLDDDSSSMARRFTR